MTDVEETLRMMQGDHEGRLVLPRAMDERSGRMVGPFAMVAHLPQMRLEPWDLPQDADVRPHPHIGLVAVTYLLEGHVTHRDSLGNRQELEPGSVACTISGKGMVHSERLDRLRLEGGGFHMFQILLALANEEQDREPAFLYVAPGDVASASGDGVTTRHLLGPGSAVEGRIGNDGFLLDVSLDAGARIELPEAPAERGVYVLSGSITAGEATVGAGQRAVLEPGPATVTASEETRLLAFGGSPVGPRYFWWNYLHGSLETLEAARDAWRRGEVTLPPGDTESFTPAPPDDGRPLRVLNPS